VIFGAAAIFSEYRTALRFQVRIISVKEEVMFQRIIYPYLGTVVNFAVVLIMGTLGTLIKRGIPKRFSDSIMAVMGACVIYIGIDGLLEAAPDTSASAPALTPGLFKILVILISVSVGTLIGELINLEKWMNKLGDVASKRLGKLGRGENFAEGFVSSSILFCVGAMTVNGAIASASGDHQLLLTKSLIDGVSVLVMSSTLGIGCAFSAFFILLYQGALTLLATLLLNAVSLATLTYMSVTGSLIVVLIGTNVLGITKVRTANMVPAMFVAVGVEALLNVIF
jgi:uncharacterized membrane protein YqgA involved in biofilm formation